MRLKHKIINMSSQDLAQKDHADNGKSDILEIPDEEDIDEDLSVYDFHKFAAMYFVSNVPPQYSRKPLSHSLLDLPHPSDQLVSLIINKDEIKTFFLQFQLLK